MVKDVFVFSTCLVSRHLSKGANRGTDGLFEQQEAIDGELEHRLLSCRKNYEHLEHPALS